MSAELIGRLQERRAAEKEQALFYRALAAEAEGSGADGLSERFNELHADEQHHVSRLTARLLEMGAAPSDLGRLRSVEASVEGWEEEARAREEAEVRAYEALLGSELDGATEALLREILETERHHAEELGGKWTPA